MSTHLAANGQILAVLSTGFAQPPKLSNALRKLHDELEESLPMPAVVYLGGWKDDFAFVLEMIDERPGWDVVTAAHSFGCWAQNARLFPAMRKRGRIVRECVWADPVCKEPLFGPLVVDPCVATLRTVRKARRGLVRSSDIVAKRSVWATDIRVNTNHASVDETEEFRAAVIRAAT